MTPIEQKRQMAEATWLGYFNRTLYEQGLITEADRNRLALRIDRRNRKPSAGTGPHIEAKIEHKPEFQIEKGM